MERVERARVALCVFVTRANHEDVGHNADSLTRQNSAVPAHNGALSSLPAEDLKEGELNSSSRSGLVITHHCERFHTSSSTTSASKRLLNFNISVHVD